MKSPRLVLCPTSVRVLGIVLLLVTVAGADDGLRVLPLESDGVPTKRMLSRFLRQKADRALDHRLAEYEKIQTPEDVSARQERLRESFLEHLGGFPERTPLNARTFGTIDGEGYRIEKIIYESQPYHYVTAVLFLPDTKPPFPAVLVPCGHDRSGKAAQQRICILLAKNGIAALSYDPIGQGERSQLLDAERKQRFKATSEHNVLGIGSIPLGRGTATYRIWDGIRSIDYLASRKEIDAGKIGVTGCSGGGTLTSYLMALDERVACAAPSCYITSWRRLLDTIGPQDAEQNIHAQLAFGMDHADYLMMQAPKPRLVLASTRDFFDIQGTWDSFRQAKRLYTRLGFPERINLIETDAKHGYPKLQREAMVRWMRRFLLGTDDHITEPDFGTHPAQQLQCTPDGQVQLLDGARSVIDLNIELNRRFDALRRKNWEPKNRLQTLDEVRRIAGIRRLKELPAAKVTRKGTLPREGFRIEKLVMASEPGIQVPGLLFVPEKPNGTRCLYLHGEGKHADAGADGPIETLVREGALVLAVDLRGMGETSTSYQDAMTSYLLGKCLVGQRAEDVLTAARVLSTWETPNEAQSVQLIAKGAAQSPAIHAAALESELFSALKLSDDVLSWSEVVRDPTKGQMADVVHGALRIYDLPDLVQSFQTEKQVAFFGRKPAGNIAFEASADFVKLPKDMKLGACAAVAVNSKGEIFLFHRGKHPVLVLNAKGEYLRSFGDREILSAHGLRIDGDDNVWVTDIGGHRVLKFDPTGNLLLALGTGKPGTGNDQFNKPTDIAFGPRGEIFISDGYGNSRVMVFNSEGRLVRQWGQPGKGRGEFRLPHSILVDRQGRVLVGDRENNRIQVFDREGSLLEVWEGFAPYGLAMDPRGRLFVADGRANKILRLDEKGHVEQSWGEEGTAPGQFRLPHMLGFDRAGNLYVAEVRGERLQQFIVQKPQSANLPTR